MVEKRQCTYAMRRKVARELHSEVRKLEFQIATLKSQFPSPIVAASDKNFGKQQENTRSYWPSDETINCRSPRRSLPSPVAWYDLLNDPKETQYC
ncbi:hypothetical protein PC129_g19526 [Phytophthora cactorum]|uniref:Uncharacterized protein n=1 Tax=Phytophthora cactorum TaxID=29920 RepID=A0A8T1HBM3_9STRA|nr:hypothetical protein PC129_g19526 [Phytophthora cactorum]